MSDLSNARGVPMTDDKIRPNPDDRPEQAEPERADWKERQSRASAADESSRRATPGRRPLFRK
jgi:hypothetical protein